LGVALGAVIALIDEREWETTTDEASRVELRHPSNWHVRRLGNYCHRIGPGLLVSNLRRHKFEHPEIRDGCTNAWELRNLPDGFVLVDVSWFAFPYGARAHAPATPLPLELDQLKTFYRPPSERCECSYAGVAVADLGYTVRVWIGKGATADVRESVEELVRSIRFNVRRS
jgi:hypothetical protein